MATEDVYSAIDNAESALTKAVAREQRGDLRNAAEAIFFAKMRLGRILKTEPHVAFGEPRPCMEEANEMMDRLVDFSEQIMPRVREVFADLEAQVA
jgi:hypothetical protein